MRSVWFNIFVLITVIAIVACAPTSKDKIEIVAYKNAASDGDGNYEFKYELSDGQNRQEQGSNKKIAEKDVPVVRGSYSFIGDDGITYTVNYVADEIGFRATGDHIPKVTNTNSFNTTSVDDRFPPAGQPDEEEETEGGGFGADDESGEDQQVGIDSTCLRSLCG